MDAFKSLIGRSPNFQSLLRSAHVIAGTDVTVLITGETGTGKEVIANALQQHSPRASKPFITLNCAALPESIAESELFGHTKGSFTGAVSNQTGKLQAAHNGTLFLDEVDSLSLPLQAKLLRFLETGECQPVGQTQTQTVNARIIAATNSSLQAKIKSGEFRQDLYFRLNVVPLQIPPLRERNSDVTCLVKYFIDIFSKQHQLDAPQFTKAAIKLLLSYSWPGNVRELRNLCERLVIFLPGKTIEPTNIPVEYHSNPKIKQPNTDIGFTLPDSGINLESLEIDLINQALIRTNGNRSQSARLLGMTRDTLLYRIQKYSITA